MGDTIQNFAAKALFAGLFLLVACQTIHTTVTRKVEIGEATFVVIEYGEIAPVDLDESDDKTTSSHIYQITSDGRYRRLGSYFPMTSENILRNQGGLGVYSEEDRDLVSDVLKRAYADSDNFLSIGNKNVETPEEAVTAVFGVEPIRVDSPGALRFKGTRVAPLVRPSTTTTTAETPAVGSGPPKVDPQ